MLKNIKQNPSLFIGLYLENEIIGAIQGFPRDNYILLSEIAVDIRFRNRKFGSLLMKEFETNAIKYEYPCIKAGAEEKAIGFYSANGYLPSLFAQVKEKYERKALEALEKYSYKITAVTYVNKITGIEIASKDCNLLKLKEIRKLLSPLSAQFLFTKRLKQFC